MQAGGPYFSLGGFCQTAWQLKRRFGAVAPSPFNSIIAPWGAVISALEDPETFGDYGLTPDGSCALDKRLGTLHPHCFPADSLGAPELSAANTAACTAELRGRMQAMDERCGAQATVTLIRLGGRGTPATLNPFQKDLEPLTSADLNGLARAITRRWPDTDWQVLLVTYEGVTEVTGEHPRFKHHTMPLPACIDDPDESWKGEDEAWDRVFEAAGDRGS